MGRPLETNLVFRLTDVMIEVVEKFVTVCGFEANQVLGKAFIDKQKPPSRDRVGLRGLSWALGSLIFLIFLCGR